MNYGVYCLPHVSKALWFYERVILIHVLVLPFELSIDCCILAFGKAFKSLGKFNLCWLITSTFLRFSVFLFNVGDGHHYLCALSSTSAADVETPTNLVRHLSSSSYHVLWWVGEFMFAATSLFKVSFRLFCAMSSLPCVVLFDSGVWAMCSTNDGLGQLQY